MTQVAVIHTAFEDTPRTVALVEVGNREGTDALEYAYRWTNNVLGSWSMKQGGDANDDVTLVADLHNIDGTTYGLRSTSMGDHMLLGNRKYKVAMVGFEEIQ
jgi:hypothetical protein